MALGLDNFKSLLASQATGTAAIMGEAIASYMGSKRRRGRRKALIAYIGANVFNIMDKKTMWNNMKGLAEFESKNQTNLEYINQRGEERKGMRRAFDKWGGKLQASSNEQGYTVLNEEEMRRNWRIAEMEKVQNENKYIYGMEQPLGQQELLTIDNNEDIWYDNLTSQAGQYDWTKTDAGLMDSYTRAKQAAESYYGDPMRQGWIGNWWNRTFGDGVEKASYDKKVAILENAVGAWKTKAENIEQETFSNPHMAYRSNHVFDTGQRQEAITIFESRLPPQPSVKFPKQTMQMYEWMAIVQKKYSDSINALSDPDKGTFGMTKNEAFFHNVYALAYDADATKYAKHRSFQTIELNKDIVKKLDGVNKDGDKQYYKELLGDLKAQEMDQKQPVLFKIFETWGTGLLKDEQRKTVIDWMRNNREEFVAQDNQMEATALRDVYGISLNLSDELANNIVRQRDALGMYSRDEITKDRLLSMFPKALASDPGELFQAYIGQYMQLKRSGYITPAQYTLDINLWSGGEGKTMTIQDWARYSSLLHLKIMMDAQDRMDEYDKFIGTSDVLAKVDIDLETYNF